MKRVIAVIVFVLTAGACSAADLRPEGVSAATVDDSARQSGIALLKETADAHGGRSRWLAKKTLSAELRDEWKALMFAVAGPWPKNGVPMRLTYLNGRDAGRIDFLETDEPDWGIQNWVTYTVEEGAEPVFVADDDIEFWIPTTSYFIEAPFRLPEATTVYELDSKELDGTRYRRVFITWGDDAPQPTTDQYVAWIDADTKRLRWLEYTIRDMGEWMAGCMEYESFETVGGFVLAKKLTTVSEPGGDPNLHRFVVDNYEVGVPVPKDYVIVDPSRSESKY